MAELGVAASIVSVVAFALSLSQKLHHFADTTSAASEQVHYIANNITNFSDALAILAERLDDEDPVYSDHTVKTVYRLYDQSCDLFDRVEDLIPQPKNGRNDLSFLQRVSWNFKKSQVEFLAGQIEYLKSTVNLIATVLFAGKKLRSRRRSRRHKETSKLKQVQLDQARERINVAVVEQVHATNKLPTLSQQVTEETRMAIEADDNHPGSATTGVIAQQNHLVRLCDVTPSLRTWNEEELDGESNKQLVLADSEEVFAQLLYDLTILDTSGRTRSSIENNHSESGDGRSVDAKRDYTNNERSTQTGSKGRLNSDFRQPTSPYVASKPTESNSGTRERDRDRDPQRVKREGQQGLPWLGKSQTMPTYASNGNEEGPIPDESAFRRGTGREKVRTDKARSRRRTDDFTSAEDERPISPIKVRRPKPTSINDDDSDEKWERHHQNTRDYIAASTSKLYGESQKRKTPPSQNRSFLERFF